MEMEQILKSWREIAEFLRVSPRTAQLWEQDSGLPVHRHAGKSRGTVFAYKDELMEWTRRQEDDDYESRDWDDPSEEDERPQAAPQPKRKMSLGQILAVALGVSLLWMLILLLYIQ